MPRGLNFDKHTRTVRTILTTIRSIVSLTQCDFWNAISNLFFQFAKYSI